MTGPRRYRLLCPIARALDHVGDRWTLLILRDLHAGPARFGDLQQGLTGIASNLLTDRLRVLQADGLVRRTETDLGVAVYELTDLGRGTDRLLFELAAFGARLARDDELQEPGNLRHLAVTLQVAAGRIVPPDLELRVALVIDGESFAVDVGDGVVDVTYEHMDDPELEIATSYEPLCRAIDGELSLDELAIHHVEVVAGDPSFRSLMWGAIEEIRSTS